MHSNLVVKHKDRRLRLKFHFCKILSPVCSLNKCFVFCIGAKISKPLFFIKQNAYFLVSLKIHFLTVCQTPVKTDI